jgi:hypothetical protein
MSTHSTISVKCRDGKRRTIYCHFDGYLSHNGRILLEHYSSQDAAEELVALGNLSGLNTSADTCVAYHRDRGDDFRMGDDFGQQDYNYTWDGKKWKCKSYDGTLINMGGVKRIVKS